VQAVVVPSSTDAAQSLGAHLAGLGAYLSEHRTPVETLTMATSGGQLGAQTMGGQGRQETGQGASYQDGSRQHADSAGSQGIPRLNVSAGSSVSGTASIVSPRIYPGSAYISVIA
jgi:hypothetical protein